MINSILLPVLLTVVGVVILGLFLVSSRKKNNGKSLRRKGFKMSVAHMLTMYLIYFLYNMLASNKCFRLSKEVQIFLILGVGIIVYMGYCILHEDKKAAERYGGIKSILITNIICVTCWIITISLYSFDELFKIKDGVVHVATADCIWFFVVPIYVVNTSILLIKYRCRR
ncbi:hypothetical protein [Pseudobutyrivibrio sp. MD2005]|uniref:hypothetical protein n=1 Tax=Pseudobutyrivibrio sp. MD2005 TaxID=1410616 RepID=UPI000483D75C|nr:hypothetical protein [Pseudobutyrivibrio sp. MD2005]